MVVKKVLIALTCFLISLTLLSYISSEIFLSFTDRNFMKLIVDKKLKENITEEDIETIIKACEINPLFSFSVNQINFSCSEFIEKNYSEIINYLSNKIVNELYEREIECEIIECLQSGKFDAILSKQGNIFFEKLKTLSFYATIFLTLFLLIITKSFISWSRKLGYTLLFTALPLYAFNFVLPKTLENITPEEIKEFIPIIVEKLSSLNHMLLKISIIGFLLIIISYIIEEIKKRKTKSH